MWPRAKTTYRSLQVVIFLLIAGGSLWLCLQVKNKPLNKEGLKIATTALRSQAVQGKLMAEALAPKKMTVSYLRGQLSFLYDKTDGIVKELLAAQPEAGLQESLVRARGIAEGLRADLANLSSSQDQETVNRIKQNLQNHVRRLADLEVTLID
jgi:hypothetical protein